MAFRKDGFMNHFWGFDSFVRDCLSCLHI